MLIKLDKLNKIDSRYECDMCKTKLNGINRFVIHISKGTNNSKKKWDLCENCLKIISKNIKKWNERKNITKKS